MEYEECDTNIEDHEPIVNCDFCGEPATTYGRCDGMRVEVCADCKGMLLK